MAESVVSFVVEKLGNAFVKEVLHLHGVSEQVEKVRRELSWIQSFLKDADRKRIVDERQKQWVKEVRDLAYWIEDVIDTFQCEVPEKKSRKRFFTGATKLPAVHKLGVEIKQIEERIQEINERKVTYGINNLGEGVGGEIIRQPVQPIVLPDVDEAGIIGFGKDIDEVVGLLLNENNSRRSVISIVGTGGLGKTTLAKKVYNRKAVRDQFEIRVWVVISQKFKLIDIVRKITEQLHIVPPQDLSGHQLTPLYQSLAKKKYLIVLDDIWTSDLWIQIGMIFPDKNNGSRILITTRNLNVAKEADPSSVPYKLSFLTPEQSIELFMKKALPNQNANERYPDNLYNIGKQFVKKCGGLPLALIVLGGLLSKKPTTYFAWSRVMETMNWGIDGEKCIDIIGTSYEDLLFALKSCFMYFAAFPEDDEIQAESLYRMWIAEGFIPQEENRTLEDTAENFLEELVQRNLVQVSRRNWNGSIDFCRIHDVLHSLAIKKAKEDNFFMACSKKDEMQNCSQQTRRLAIHQIHNFFVPTEVAELYGKLMSSATPNLRSLLCPSRGSLMLKVSQLAYLKVLHFNSSTDYETEKFGRLNQLRYFKAILIVKSSKKDVCSFQKFIGGMRFLQTLDFSGCGLHRSYIPCDLPDCVWHVKTLRHVMLPRYVAGPPPSIDLTNLQTLEGVRSRESWETTGVPKLPNLKCFGIKLYEIQRDTITTLLGTQKHLISLKIDEKNVPFPMIDMREFPFYHRLQSLELLLNHQNKIALDVGMLPVHLTVLILDVFSQRDPMPELEKLQNLRYLCLSGSGFQQMYCSAGGFVQLENLILQTLIGAEEWEIEEGAMPKLKKLSIMYCHLMRIPCGLQHLTVLQDLRWYHISKDMENEVRSVCKHVPSVDIKPVENNIARTKRGTRKTQGTQKTQSTQQRQGGGNNAAPPLLMLNDKHASKRAYTHPEDKFRTRRCKMSFAYSTQIKSILSGFGLNYIALLAQMNIDWALITALVERWRGETHTFHLPTGEIAPTLQDVCCLLGLPNDGEPLMGDINKNFADLFEAVFERVDWDMFHSLRGTHHVSVEFLQKPFVPEVEEDENNKNKKRVEAKLPEDSPPEVVKTYAISFMLDLFGSVMFPNKSGYLYAHFLALIQDVSNPRKFSWGSGMLAYLYRGLCKGAEEETRSFAFSALFLQIWAWTRFPIGRPKPNYIPKDFEAMPLGARWMGLHNYGDVVHGSVSGYRREFEKLRDDDINWDPYNLDDLPDFCRSENEMELWFYDGPLIWFYIVEAHPIQRVMRQMKKRQVVPPPLLSCPDRLHAFENIPFECVDWATTHAEWLTIWNARRQHLVTNIEPFSNADFRRYMAWFNANGMHTVFCQSSTADEMIHPQPVGVNNDPLERRLVPRAETVQQNIIRNVTIAHDAVAAMREFTGRARAFARRVLLGCRDNLHDFNRGDIFEQFKANNEVSDADLMVSADEHKHLNPIKFQWVQDNLGGNYADHLPERFVFRTQPQQFSQTGLWEHDGTSGDGVGISQTNLRDALQDVIGEGLQ